MNSYKHEQSVPETKSIKGKGHCPPEHAVAFFTLLSILLKMKQEVGLESMLEFMTEYRGVIAQFNPKIRSAVDEALLSIPVEKIYRNMVGHD